MQEDVQKGDAALLRPRPQKSRVPFCVPFCVPEEMEVLFTLLAERCERGSVMLTSNLPFSKWEQIFKDAMTTAAAIDRLVHHSVILKLNVSSCRLENANKPDASQAGKRTKSA